MRQFIIGVIFLFSSFVYAGEEKSYFIYGNTVTMGGYPMIGSGFRTNNVLTDVYSNHRTKKVLKNIFKGLKI